MINQVVVKVGETPIKLSYSHILSAIGEWQYQNEMARRFLRSQQNNEFTSKEMVRLQKHREFLQTVVNNINSIYKELI